jgi:uncharacterized protein (DUF983 family)
MGQLRAAPLWRSGLLCRCPRCGLGKIYTSYLKIGPRCAVCELDYSFADPGDGPAVFVILVAGAFIVACAIAVELNFKPPFWVHVVIWGPLTIGTCLSLLPPFKAMLFALQYRNQSGEGRLQ